MKFLCHPVYKYLILIIAQYLIFKYSIKVDNNIDKILLVNIFMVFLIDLIIIEDYQELLFDYKIKENNKEKKKDKKKKTEVIDDDDFVSYDTKSIITEHFSNNDVEGHTSDKYTYVNNYNDSGIPLDKYNEINRSLF